MGDQQRLEEARQRVSRLLTVGDVIGRVDPAAIRSAALVKISSSAERFSVLLANLILTNAEMLALLLAGQVDEGVIADLLAPKSEPPADLGQFADWLFASVPAAPPQAPKLRDGQPVGPDGYTDSERDYMRGAGVDPNVPKPAAPEADRP